MEKHPKFDYSDIKWQASEDDVPGIFVQASAEPNDCVKPNEQNRVYSIFAMASNRTFKNLFGLCRVQPKISKKWQYATGHTNNTTH